MKKFVRFVAELKTYAALSYSATLCVVMAIFWLMDVESIPISTLFQLLLLSLCASLLSWLCFTPVLFGRMRYTLRLALFMALFFPVLTAFALVCHWFPVSEAGSWITFVTIFFLIGGIMTLGYEIFFRASGNRYDGLLNEYRARHGKSPDQPDK